MNNRPALLIAMLSALTLSGCGAGYEHAPIGVDSPRGREVSAMLDQLHGIEPAALDTFIQAHAAESLTAAQSAALRTLLTNLAGADHATLTAIDQFGPQVYRVEIAMKQAAKTTKTYALLVLRNDRLIWAGPN
jgi:hypothetical protein